MKIIKSILLLAVIIIIGWLAINTKAYAAPPANFQTTQIIGSGLSSPSGFEFAPDGRIFILERTGNVRIYKNGQLLTTPFASSPSSINGDKGLIGVTFDPDFANNHFVYFYHTSSADEHGRLVRFNASSDVGTDYTVLYDTPEGILQFHAGGGLAFGPDGKLYLSIGDNGIPSNAQSLSNPFGKMHRFNKDGTIPTDNPFYNTPGAVKSIWAYGFRNPWRFQFDTQTGKLYDGDVGQDTWEEIDRVEKGLNYGWPTIEGNCTSNCSSFTDPIYTYNHNGGSAAIALGPVYRANMFPQEYKGSLFFGDYANGFIKKIGLDSNGNSTGVSDFDTNAGSAVDLKVAPDGSLYYVTYFPGRLYKITYSTSNQAPTANATADVTKGNQPLTVNFSSAGTTDPDNDPITYSWDFGDSTTSTQANPTKVYNTQGTYTVELTVSDGSHNAQAVPIVIQVGVPPSLNIASPTDGLIYRAGDTISYSAFAADAAGVDLPPSAFTVEILFHHQTHTHPFIGPISGSNTGTFIIPTTGEPSADTWYELIISAKDSNNLVTKKSVNIYPKKSNITLNTNPATLDLTLDGTIIHTPTTFPAVVGFKRQITAALTQSQGTNGYQFSSWSDAGAIDHQITTQETDTTYTANYNSIPAFSASYFANQTLNGNPVLTRNDTDINFDWGNGTPDPLVPSDHFSARWTRTSDFAAGDYEFTATADDGIRLYVDNQLVLDKWIDQSTTTYKVTRTLSAGPHTLKVEYYENTGGAVAKLSYQLASVAPPQDTNIALSATGYRWSKNTTDTANTNRVAAAGINDNDLATNVNLNAGDDNANAWEGAGVVWASPQDSISSVKYKNGTWDGAQNGAFSANFKLQFTTDGTTWTDSGWTSSPAYNYDSPSSSLATYTFTGPTVSGKIGARVVGQVRTANALSWIGHAAELQVFATGTPPPQDTNIFLGQYFANQTLTGSPILTRNDSAINFDWGNGSPDPAIPSDHFSVRWTKTQDFTAGNYSFTLKSDDGIRFWIDNQLLVDDWTDHGTKTYNPTANLTANSHTLKIEYYENGGGAVASFQQN